MIAPGIPGRHFMQMAFIVDDLDAAALRWVKTTGAGPFLKVPHVQLVEYTYRGQAAGGLDFSVAIVQSGGVQVELIQQHCDNPSAYRDLIARGKTGFHHLGIYTADYDATLRHYHDQGFVSAIDGLFGEMRFAYVDTSAAIGCMIEVIEEHPFQTEYFQRVAAAADGWDGVTDPVRLGFPATESAT